MATPHRLNLMSNLGYLRLDQGTKKRLHSHYPELRRRRARTPHICNRTLIVIIHKTLKPSPDIISGLGGFIFSLTMAYLN